MPDLNPPRPRARAVRPWVGLWVGLCAGPWVGVATATDDCRDLAVTAADGYANVRSSPRLDPGNLLAAVPAGIRLQPAPTPAAGPRDWLRVQGPVAGWVHRGQVGCGIGGEGDDNAGLAAIERLARRGQAGDRQAAASFMLMSRTVDGALADAYAEALAAWAESAPATLAALIKRQGHAARARVLQSLDLGLGEGTSPARRRFEAAFGRAR